LAELDIAVSYNGGKKRGFARYRELIEGPPALSHWVWILSEEDFRLLFKEIAYSYPVDDLWQQYKRLPTQTSHMILNIKAQSYRFIVVDVQ
jgi:hypothetical protein